MSLRDLQDCLLSCPRSWWYLEMVPTQKARLQEPVKSNKHSLGEDWCLCPCFRWGCGSSVYWKHLFAGLMRPRSLRNVSFPALLCTPVLPGVGQGRKRRPTTFTNQSEGPCVFEAAGCELHLSLRHFHSPSVAPELSTERNLASRKSDPFSMYHYQNCD